MIVIRAILGCYAFKKIKFTNTENIANVAFLNFLTLFTITLRYRLSKSAHSNLKLEYKFLSMYQVNN